ncbi:MAG TPA: hypothetical protein DEA44_13975 [Firmicutes bacterium]|nr:hypothetical protein [Bacillota bacterium]
MMATREIKIISETDVKLFAAKVSDFITQNPVENMLFSTTETKEGVLYSVMLSIMPADSFLQV